MLMLMVYNGLPKIMMASPSDFLDNCPNNDAISDKIP